MPQFTRGQVSSGRVKSYREVNRVGLEAIKKREIQMLVKLEINSDMLIN
jgi:hypothetical protein